MPTLNRGLLGSEGTDWLLMKVMPIQRISMVIQDPFNPGVDPNYNIAYYGLEADSTYRIEMLTTPNDTGGTRKVALKFSFTVYTFYNDYELQEPFLHAIAAGKALEVQIECLSGGAQNNGAQMLYKSPFPYEEGVNDWNLEWAIDDGEKRPRLQISGSLMAPVSTLSKPELGFMHQGIGHDTITYP